MAKRTSEIRTNPRPFPASLARRTKADITWDQMLDRARAFRLREAQLVKPGPKRPRIVSSAHGPIEHILLCYPSYASGEYSYKAVYLDLFKQLPKTTRFTVLCHPNVLRDLQSALKTAKADNRATIVEAPSYLNFLVWAEDPYVTVEDIATSRTTTFLVEPFVFDRVGDAVIADLVADATTIQSVQSPLYFQGGNFLVGDDFVLLGADYPTNSMNLIQMAGHVNVPDNVDLADFVKNLFRQTFDPKRKLFYVGTKLPVPLYAEREIKVNGEKWTEVIYAGTGDTQPIFHIDMFISLAGRAPSGKYRLLVGSPAYADRILKRPDIEHALAPIFDDVAKNLERLGFEVIRNPLPLTFVDFKAEKVRFWYFATANNCLVSIDAKQGKHVWLPTYGHGAWKDLTPIDAENKKIWQQLGFTVHELTDYHPFAQNLGSVHCIKKYLSR